MFETSMVLARPRRVRRAGVFAVSVVAHTMAIAGALTLSVASTGFPQEAPDESAMFLPVEPPPPLGRLDGGAPPRPAAAPAEPRPQTPPPANQITAPVTVPDEVPAVDGPSSGDAATADPGAGSPEPYGVPWGTRDSPGRIDAPPSTVTIEPVEQKIYEAVGEVIAPVVLHRVEPPYPPSLARLGVPATVAVRCVIDRNGYVRDPQVTLPAKLQPFNDEVLEAVRQWRFKPGSYRGQAVEVYFDLTVTFSVRR